MESSARIERRRFRWFFAGLLVVSSVLGIVNSLVVTHQTRSQLLERLLPTSVTLGGRTGAVLSGLGLLLLAAGIARGKRVALRVTLLVLAATVVFDLAKDLDFEVAALFEWILFGLWWFRHHFDADSDPLRMRWGLAVLAIGLLTAFAYAMVGATILASQLQPEVGVVRTLESLLLALSGSPTRYRALTERAEWFLGTLPVVSYGLILLALTPLLRPVLAPRAAAADRERLHSLLGSLGRNYISHLAVHGASSYFWLDDGGCVACWIERAMRASTTPLEARSRGVVEVSLGVTPRVDAAGGAEGAWRAMFWGLDRFQRSRTLGRFKEKFGPRWEDRYLAVPGGAVLPEVVVALARAHVPPLSAGGGWLRSLRSTEPSSPRRRG